MGASRRKRSTHAVGSLETAGPSSKQFTPRTTFGSRTQEPTKLGTPGPGSYYEPSVDKLARYVRTPKFSFGSSSRQEPRRQHIPGPGAYAHRPLMSREAPAFSCTPRRHESGVHRGDKHPGPGSHNLPDLVGIYAPKHAITPRREPPRSATAPAPGDYACCATLCAGNAPGWGFGAAPQRPREPDNKADSTPGPGAYRHGCELADARSTSRERPGAGAADRMGWARQEPASCGSAGGVTRAASHDE